MELIIMGIFMCVAFVLGRTTAPKQAKEQIKLPKIKSKKQDFKLDDATITMLENINNYDGTANNQKDVPEEV